MSTEAGVKLDDGKLKMSLIPHEALTALGEVLTFGANKYTPEGWRTVTDAKTRYTDALLRHYCAYQSGESVDEESGLSHLKHMLTNIAFLVALESEEEPSYKLRHRNVMPISITDFKVGDVDLDKYNIEYHTKDIKGE